MSNIPETNLTLEQVLPAYFKLVQEHEESRKVNQQLVAMFDRSSERAEEFEKKYEDLRSEVEKISYNYRYTNRYTVCQLIEQLLLVNDKHFSN
jgi:hypothetical protein